MKCLCEKGLTVTPTENIENFERLVLHVYLSIFNPSPAVKVYIYTKKIFSMKSWKWCGDVWNYGFMVGQNSSVQYAF